MTFLRLTRGDWVAVAASLALLLVMALDWYSTEGGVQAREDQQQIEPRGATAGEVSRALDESARIAAENAEKNAWQAEPFADRVILYVLLAAVVAAIGSAWLRAAGKRFEPPLTPSSVTAAIGLAGVLLLAGRILQKPEAEIGAVVKMGAPLGLVCVGVLTIGARAAWNAERDGSAWGEGPAEEPAAGEPAGETRDAQPASARPAPLFDPIEPPGATATAVRPVTADHPAAAREHDEPDADWAPDWSEQLPPPDPEPEPAAEERPRWWRRGARK